MKHIFKIAAFALLVMLGSSLQNTVSAQYYDNDRDDSYQNNDRDVSYQTFYDELSPHGQWVDYPGQGYVWVPDAGPDFRPYSTNGHWVWTENYEWMWVSDYDWGWAPFHYGRWDNDPSYGWYWVPGYEWSPAWVAWRDGGDYYGWAPIRPGIRISINFNIGGYSPPNDFWCFAPRRYITSPRIYDYCVDRRQNVTIINYTTVIVNNYQYGNNYGFRSGPSRYDAERYTGRINPVRFRATSTPGRSQFRNNEVSIYRPNVRRDDNRQTAPRQFDRYDRSTARNNDNGFRRNDNTNRGNDNVSTRGNNLPSRENRVNNNPNTERRDNNDFRQQRSNSNDGQNGRTDERRVTRPTERTERVPDQQNNDRRFDRQNGNNGSSNAETRNNDGSQRRSPQQMERRQQPQQVPQEMERRQEQRQPSQQMERRQEQRQVPQQMERRQQQQMPQQTEQRQEQRQQPQQMEHRQEQRQAPQQMERRQEQRQAPQQVERRQEQPQQQPARQTERRDNAGEHPQGNGNSGQGNGKKRF
ncbi:MAG: DUF6600 domain-containing protein [Chitinophagaceae bacterium]